MDDGKPFDPARGRPKVAGMNDRLVWIDCEMTGLNLERDAIVEVAALVTDNELNVLGEGVDLVIRPPDEALRQMAPIVQDMHLNSGLLDQLDAGVTLGEAQTRVLSYVKEYVPEPRRAPLAGNTVFVDRAFLARDMPELEQWMHYRIVDVSSVKELARRWYPRVYFNSPAKAGNHRALADIRESIAELRYYRGTVFVPLPGPDSAAARAFAASLGSVPADRTESGDGASGAVPSPAAAAADDSRSQPIPGTSS
jgi:oligoribonuclease